MQHTIIGAGPAGVVAAEKIRQADRDVGISIYSDEPVSPYSRMAIPYYLNNKIDESGTYLRKNDQHFADLNIEVGHKTITEVDVHNRRIHFSDQATSSYDRLLVASGSRPMTPFKNLNHPSVTSCWTLADAHKIVAKTEANSDVVLMGAGFIGCIILEALASRGVNLTVVELESRMVPRMMNEQSSFLLKKWCTEKGVTILTSTRVTGIETSQNNRGKAKATNAESVEVQLDNGNTITADLVIIATGVRPNTDFLKNSGIDITNGILVNRSMQSSNPDVFAAGDVARGKDFSSTNYSIQAIQPTAVDHASIAALNMLGRRDVQHQGSINMNVLDTMGLISTSFGSWEGVAGGDYCELSDPESFSYINLQFADDLLVGANTLGHTAHIGVIRGLIQSKARLGRWKQELMQNPLLLMEAYLATSQPEELSRI